MWNLFCHWTIFLFLNIKIAFKSDLHFNKTRMFLVNNLIICQSNLKNIDNRAICKYFYKSQFNNSLLNSSRNPIKQMSRVNVQLQKPLRSFLHELNLLHELFLLLKFLCIHVQYAPIFPREYSFIKKNYSDCLVM